jgi:hypothetical protein
MSNIPRMTAKQVAYIKKNIGTLPFERMRSKFNVTTEVMYELIKQAYNPNCVQLVDDDDVELHSTYLVTLNQFNYMVKFNVPIEFNTIQFCGHQVGYDYEVCKLGDWEYNHLRSNIPCINIKTDGNYVANFWSTTKLWKQ